MFLAREADDNAVGINYLEKIQTAHLPSIFGAMLAGVGDVLMGAGIPAKIPGVLDRLANGRSVEYQLHVTGAQEYDDTTMHLEPKDYVPNISSLYRPRLLVIVSSGKLATTIVNKAKWTGRWHCHFNKGGWRQ